MLCQSKVSSHNLYIGSSSCINSHILIDLIAIPDFVSGAMEHWGLVTFRETALLFNPTESSSANQKRVATVVAHELAHQYLLIYLSFISATFICVLFSDGSEI